MKLLNYLEFIKEGLIKTQPADVVLRKVIFLPNNLIYGINYKIKYFIKFYLILLNFIKYCIILNIV